MTKFNIGDRVTCTEYPTKPNDTFNPIGKQGVITNIIAPPVPWSIEVRFDDQPDEFDYLMSSHELELISSPLNIDEYSFRKVAAVVAAVNPACKAYNHNADDVYNIMVKHANEAFTNNTYHTATYGYSISIVGKYAYATIDYCIADHILKLVSEEK